MYTRQLSKKGKVYTITYDEYHDLDTVECDGKFLSTKNANVKIIANNADAIFNMHVPNGFERV